MKKHFSGFLATIFCLVVLLGSAASAVRPAPAAGQAEGQGGLTARVVSLCPLGPVKKMLPDLAGALEDTGPARLYTGCMVIQGALGGVAELA